MIFLIAWRNIWRNKTRSLVIMLSVAIGIFAGIAVLALYKGMMNSRVNTVIYAETGHIQIHDPQFKKDYEPTFIINNSRALIDTLQKLPSVKYFATRVITQGMLATTSGSAGVQVNGVDPLQEKKVSGLVSKIKEGGYFGRDKKNQVLIGKKLADKMKLKPGSKLVLTFTDTSANMIASAFRVAGVYQSDNSPLDERNVYVQQTELAEMLGIQNSFHEVCIILHEDEAMENTLQQLRQKFSALLIESWKSISPETNLMIDTIDTTSYIIISIILFALAFGIVNTMLMAILERAREIGVMMALGMNRLRLFLLVFLETVFLTMIGTPVGIGAAWLITGYYHRHGLNWESMGKEMMSSFGFSTTIYPAFPGEKLGMITGFVVLAAVLSCLYPAIKALKLKPIEALRK